MFKPSILSSHFLYLSPRLSSTSSLHIPFIFSTATHLQSSLSRIHSSTLQLYQHDIIRNRERVCSLLVERGALVTSVNNKNWTPLHMESVFPINRT